MSASPAVGQVIRYSYLWSEEHLAGREEGLKDRPCVIIVAVEPIGRNLTIVTVLPVTHRPPSDPSVALEMPLATKLRLGLDDLPSWIILSESNSFRWPGPDIRPVDGKMGTLVYGELPYKFTLRLRSAFVSLLRMKRSTIIPRTE